MPSSPALLRRLNAAAPDFSASLNHLLAPPAADSAVAQRVANMRADIAARGDAALLDYCRTFDDFSPATPAALELPRAEWQDAPAQIAPALRQDLAAAAARLQEYHRRQLPTAWRYTDEHGNELGENVAAVQRAVVYAPGGTAAYPSSALMGIIPAKIAGVPEIILATPARGGVIPPATLAAAALAGCHRVFQIGGAQAIIGFALGTATLPAADVIVGPGNAYVAEAKRQLVGTVGLDSIAGPSEVTIISDDSAPPDWVAADLAAQAEHDRDSQCILLTPSAAHADAVEKHLAAQLPHLPRADIIRDSLAVRGACIIAGDIAQCCQIANRIAPEHLQLMTKDNNAAAAAITNAGGLFIGNYASVPFGDYLAGANHVLPTAGTARFASPLSVRCFVKYSGVFRASAQGAAALAPRVARLAQAEGLQAHARSAILREKPPATQTQA